MNNPIATYRIQFHKDFTFADLEKILPYLEELGIGTLYASPVLKATPGSTHGYDALDPNEVNPEIGTEESLRALSSRLKAKGIGWLQDIVPNHMAFDTRNPWLASVLELGPQSPHAAAFDIAWTSTLHQGRVMVPFLGASLEEVVSRKELQLAVEEGGLGLKYYESLYPLSPRSYKTILAGGGPQALEQLSGQLEDLLRTEEPTAFAAAWQEWRAQLAALLKNETVATALEKTVSAINEDASRLMALLEEQAYHLCHWQETDSRINYRRFFTVNGLICLNIQNEEVLNEHHQLVLRLVKEGVISGLRIDHIDGLFDPTGYLQKLRALSGDETYITVEKILEPGEALPRQWPVAGTTGYDFLAQVNNLLTLKSSEGAFTQFYNSLVNDPRFVPQQIRDKKAHILYQHMNGELDNLYHLFMQTGLVTEEDYAQLRTEDIRTAIAELLIHCPVYRFYCNTLPLPDEEREALQRLFDQVKASRPDLTPAVDLLAQVVLHRPLQGDADYQQRALYFYQRCMQFSGPLMAKGVEDTLMYTYNRFLGHNEVGDSPETFGLSLKAFHRAMQHRQRHWPLALNATATHDTKRGEDARARLNVLTALPDEWIRAVEGWQSVAAPLKINGAPDANDEYLIYQALLASHPFPGQPEEGYADRLGTYLEKALREAKRHSNWTSPNEAYEKATKDFALSLLGNEAFRKTFDPFLRLVTDHGVVNSLAQTVLKFTCPGVPDVYQGCEGWDLSFVDPDNRRPVDYETKTRRLQELKETAGQEGFLSTLWEHRADAGIKLWLTQALFQLRRQHAGLLSQGAYQPLKVEGKYAANVIAFARRYRGTWLVVALPLYTALLGRKGGKNPLELDWADTRVLLPAADEGGWEGVLTEDRPGAVTEIAVGEVFKRFPALILTGREKINQRGAGLLMHITSLPSPFGIGDLGPEAFAFADFLARSNQKYWQLLPLNPTEAGQAHSPYSSISSRAGNPLLISPQKLVEDGLLSEEALAAHQLPQEGRTLYEEAERVKRELLEQAWQRFRAGGFEALTSEFTAFCEREKSWLDDYALYLLLKEQHGGKPWYEWEEGLKLHEEEAVQKVSEAEGEALEKIRFIQFLFDRQWTALKRYCNDRQIRFIGDLPIYVSYDSADVWGNRHLFALDEEGNRTGLAGVPPDAFSADGQLWGMPVYNWEVLKEEGYAWWIDRLRKNIALFDLVRLDHFRAFADYWEVPAGEETARNGSWKPGPGAAFFDAVKTALGHLPFVAEDLGEINEAVFQLRDRYNMPGMKILLFAFGEEMSKSDYIPHNYAPNFIVYTGTHDNNTVRGWYRDEADEETRNRLQQYLGRGLSEDEVPSLLCRMAYASVANTAILPLQDVLGLDGIARMNVPASGEDNWSWRLLPGQLASWAEEQLKEWTLLYNRD
jgi:malto-oligosyltrehalose synthase/4-alpha-glucanotransferase